MAHTNKVGTKSSNGVDPCSHAEQEVGLQYPNPDLHTGMILFTYGVPVYARCLVCGLKKGFWMPPGWSIFHEDWPTLSPETL